MWREQKLRDDKHISARNKIAMSMSDWCVDTETVRVPMCDLQFLW